MLTYHSCRPTDVDSYYQDGLRIACHRDFVNSALDVFASGQFEEISIDDVLRAGAEMSDIDDAKLYLALDDRHLLHCAGHYLLYGCEHIIGIAALLCRKYGRDYRQHLKSIGRPTVFEVELPFSWMALDCQMELSSALSEAVLYDSVAHERDFTITLRRPIPPEYIRSHYHPSMILDPLTGEIWRDDM